MTKFNKGDRVVRTGFSFNGVKQGEVYTVNRQRDNVLYLEGFRAGYDADRFELANVTKPVPPWPFRGTHKGTFSGSQINLQNLPKAEGAYNPNVGHTKDGGGLQQHSVGGPYPFVLVGIDNPTGLKPGLYWFVQDKTGRRVSRHYLSCDEAGRVAAADSQLNPNGITDYPTPPLPESDGYIPPLPTLVTIELTREAAEVLQLMSAHTAGPLAGHILSVITEALGYDYIDTKERHDVSFCGFGPEYTSGWHKGRNTRGALAITHKGAL